MGLEMTRPLAWRLYGFTAAPPVPDKNISSVEVRLDYILTQQWVPLVCVVGSPPHVAGTTETPAAMKAASRAMAVPIEASAMTALLT